MRSAESNEVPATQRQAVAGSLERGKGGRSAGVPVSKRVPERRPPSVSPRSSRDAGTAEWVASVSPSSPARPECSTFADCTPKKKRTHRETFVLEQRDLFHNHRLRLPCPGAPR